MRKLVLLPDAEEQLCFLQVQHPILAKRVDRMMQECLETPEKGIGKPKPLRGDWSGYYSRRVSDRHRMIYYFDETAVTFIRVMDRYEE